jgi:hypothetical protein
LCLAIVRRLGRTLLLPFFIINAASIDMESYTEYWTLSPIVLFPTHYKQCSVKNNTQIKLSLKCVGLRMREN